MADSTTRGRDRLREPSADRLPDATPGRQAILAAHDDALDRGNACYADPLTGLLVMTAQALLDRGVCCRLGCRHCPFVR